MNGRKNNCPHCSKMDGKIIDCKSVMFVPTVVPGVILETSPRSECKCSIGGLNADRTRSFRQASRIYAGLVGGESGSSIPKKLPTQIPARPHQILRRTQFIHSRRTPIVTDANAHTSPEHCSRNHGAHRQCLAPKQSRFIAQCHMSHLT